MGGVNPCGLNRLRNGWLPINDIKRMKFDFENYNKIPLEVKLKLMLNHHKHSNSILACPLCYENWTRGLVYKNNSVHLLRNQKDTGKFHKKKKPSRIRRIDDDDSFAHNFLAGRYDYLLAGRYSK